MEISRSWKVLFRKIFQDLVFNVESRSWNLASKLSNSSIFRTACNSCIYKRTILDEKFWTDQLMILYQICPVTHPMGKIMMAKISKSKDKYFVENWENLGMRLSNRLPATVYASNNRLQPFRSKRSSASSIPSKSNPSKTHQAM